MFPGFGGSDQITFCALVKIVRKRCPRSGKLGMFASRDAPLVMHERRVRPVSVKSCAAKNRLRIVWGESEPFRALRHVRFAVLGR